MSPQCLVAILLVAVHTATGEMFYLHNLLRADKENAPYFQNEHGQRFLQLQSSITNETCTEEDSRFLCNVETSITSSETNQSKAISATVGCNSTAPGDTNYREATSSCECSALVQDIQSGDRTLCSCAVCPTGTLGNNPIAIDCGDQVVIDDCLSMDCEL